MNIKTSIDSSGQAEFTLSIDSSKIERLPEINIKIIGNKLSDNLAENRNAEVLRDLADLVDVIEMNEEILRRDGWPEE